MINNNLFKLIQKICSYPDYALPGDSRDNEPIDCELVDINDNNIDVTVKANNGSSYGNMGSTCIYNRDIASGQIGLGFDEFQSEIKCDLYKPTGNRVNYVASLGISMSFNNEKMKMIYTLRIDNNSGDTITIKSVGIAKQTKYVYWDSDDAVYRSTDNSNPAILSIVNLPEELVVENGAVADLVIEEEITYMEG